MPSIVIIDGRRVHEFTCTALGCKGRGREPRKVRRYLDTTDRNSTGNLRKHARLCWGIENIAGADACGNLNNARVALNNAKKLKDGSITAVFKRKGKGKLTYSHRQHDKAQTRFVVTIAINNRTKSCLGRRSFVGFRRASDRFLLSVIEVSSA